VIWLRACAARPNPRDNDRPIDSTSTIDARGGDAPGGQSAADECYRLISIDAVRAPEDCMGSDWHRYRIAQGGNGITGYRCGNLARVTADVEAIVTALNQRRDWKKIKDSKSQRRAVAAAQRARGASRRSGGHSS
jgi:hypothetical protein